MKMDQEARGALAGCVGALKVISMVIPKDTPLFRYQGILETIWAAEKVLDPMGKKWNPEQAGEACTPNASAKEPE